MMNELGRGFLLHFFFDFYIKELLLKIFIVVINLGRILMNSAFDNDGDSWLNV